MDGSNANTNGISQDRPNGWTDRMQPLPPRHGGAVGERIPDDIPSYAEAQRRKLGAQQADPAANHGQANAKQGEAISDNATTEAKYWYDEAMNLRKEMESLRPLKEYESLIEYMATNDEAAQLVIDHMSGKMSNNNGEQNAMSDLESDLYGDNGRSGARPNQDNAPPKPVVNNAESEARKKIYDEVHAELLRQGIPSHEADMHIKFMLNPGQISASELIHMSRALRESRNGQSQNTNVQNNQGVSREPKQGNNGFPPMSVAGVSGQSSDPRTQQAAKTVAKTRAIYDPNNAM